MNSPMINGYTARPDAGPEMNAGLGYGPVQSCMVAVAVTARISGKICRLYIVSSYVN